jgi:hypothetical protein
LHASYYCGITDQYIKNLNLIELNVEANKNITNINHMSNLKILFAQNSKISDLSIQNLNLTILNANNNPNITNINYINNLKELYACGKLCGIGNNGIKNLNLIKLESTNNNKIIVI